MKIFVVIILLFAGGIACPQTLRAKLQGDWVCTKIIDTKGRLVSGKFGESDEYLRFSFVKGNLAITEAPFDRGLKMPIIYYKDYIDLFPEAQFAPPESKYYVKLIEDDQMILTTKSENGTLIEYHFLYENALFDKFRSKNSEIDIGTIVIRHIRYGKNDSKSNGKAITKRYSKSPDKDSIKKVNIVSVGTNRIYEYKIGNGMENLLPCPIFNHPTSN